MSSIRPTDGRHIEDLWYLEQERERYRIEADLAMGEYDALEVDAGIMAEALGKIASPRPNKPFDAWACGVAQQALAEVSDRVTALGRGGVSPSGKERGE